MLTILFRTKSDETPKPIESLSVKEVENKSITYPFKIGQKIEFSLEVSWLRNIRDYKAWEIYNIEREIREIEEDEGLMEGVLDELEGFILISALSDGIY